MPPPRRACLRESPVYVNMPRCSSTRRQSLAPPGGGLSTRSSAACSARRMPTSRAAIPASSRRHAAHRLGSPRMVATTAAPCCGGDECVRRMVRRSCCPTLSAIATSWQLPMRARGEGLLMHAGGTGGCYPRHARSGSWAQVTVWAAGLGSRDGDHARTLGVEPHVLGVALHCDHLDAWDGACAWHVHGACMACAWRVHGM